MSRKARAYKHIILKSPNDLAIIQANGRIIAETFQALKDFIVPGISTLDIDRFVEEKIRKNGGIPSFKGYGGFTGSVCASVNDVVIHGIPSADNILKEGDIISIDIGVYKNGFHADSANTFAVGIISEEAKKLLDITAMSLAMGIKAVKPTNTLFDIANAIQNSIDENQYGIVTEFVGHGVGQDLHEPPQVPNYRQPGLSKIKLQVGMVLAIEPMVTIGSGSVFTEADGWTVRSKEGGLAAHFEHTVAVTLRGAMILTSL